MTRLTALMMLGVLAAAPRVSAACRSVGTQLDCDMGSSRVVIGTQTEQHPTRAFPMLSFQGDGEGADQAASAHRFTIELQNFGGDPTLCRKIGNETYCY